MNWRLFPDMDRSKAFYPNNSIVIQENIQEEFSYANQS
jgi:hypothetical protein